MFVSYILPSVVSKIKSIISIIFDTVYGAVRFNLTASLMKIVRR